MVYVNTIGINQDELERFLNSRNQYIVEININIIIESSLAKYSESEYITGF